MEKVDFVTNVIEAEEQGPEYYLKKEVLDNISSFSRAVQPFLLKYVNGRDIGGRKRRRIDSAISKWWIEEYDFPFEFKEARESLLTRKYAPPEKLKEAEELQISLLKALKDNNQGQVADLKDDYIKKFPGQLEGISSLFDLPEFLNKQKELTNNRSLNQKQERKLIEECTEYRFLLTDFIIHNSGNKEFLRMFWEVADQVGIDNMELPRLRALRRGILSQVATYKTFEALGMDPKLSHPREDAFKAIDMWFRDKNALQVKGNTKNKEMVLARATEVAFPGVLVDAKADRFKNTRKHVNHINYSANEFKLKIDEYSEQIDEDIKGYYFVIPHAEFDDITGEPSEKIIAFVKSKIEESFGDEIQWPEHKQEQLAA